MFWELTTLISRSASRYATDTSVAIDRTTYSKGRGIAPM